MDNKPILLKNIHIPNYQDIDVYIKNGGYEALKKALFQKKPNEIIEEVKASNLRGRGGAGFPTGLKWSFTPKNTGKKVYLICNADESEPGTFKDRCLIEKTPHQVLEGIIIASYALESQNAYIYIRGEFDHPEHTLQMAIKQAYSRGYLGKNIIGSSYSLDIVVHKGAGAYICGEETGLIESLEGKRGYPRLKPPFPAVVGLFGGPTVINNVETLANVPHIVLYGAEWFKGIGTEKSPGTKLIGVSGHVNNQGLYELPMGYPLNRFIYDIAGGIRDNKKLKAVIPGGSSVPVLTAGEINVNMDFDSLKDAGSMLGSAGVIVMDEDTCMVNACYNLSRFYTHESCGQCTPCRVGTDWMMKILGRIENGKGKDGDLDLLLDICDNISFKTICPLGDAAIGPVQSFIIKFRSEFEDHILNSRCPMKLN